MINFTNNGSSTSIEFIDNPRYLNAGTIEVPLNSLALEFDGSGLALFKKAANGDVFFQCFPSETNLATREAIETFYQSYMVGTTGGGSGTGAVDSVNGKTGTVVLSATDVGAVAKTDFDSYSATVQTAIDSKADQADIPSLEGYLTKDSADTLYATAGSLDQLEAKDTELEGEIASHEQAFNSYTAKTDTAIAGKQDTLVSGTNIKTINGQTLLGQGNIDIQGGGGTSYTAGEGINISEANEISVDKAALAIPTAQTGQEGTSTNYIYSKYVSRPLYDARFGGSIPENCVLGYPKVWRTASSFQLEFNTYNDLNTGFGGDSEFIVTDEYAGFMKATDKVKLDSIPEGSTIALKSEIPSLEGYLTKASADTVYQPIGDYVTGEEMSAYTYDKATIDGKISGGGTFDPTSYYTKTDVNGLLDDKVDTTAFTEYTGSVQTALEAKVDTTAFTEYSGSVQTTLESKADKSAVPTLQADNNGTPTNYIYSESGPNQVHSVLNKVDIGTVGGQLTLVTRNWGDNEDGIITAYFPKVTTTVDGLMAPTDKSKLDGIPSEVYSKGEIDTKIGDIESLLAAI